MRRVLTGKMLKQEKNFLNLAPENLTLKTDLNAFDC